MTTTIERPSSQRTTQVTAKPTTDLYVPEHWLEGRPVTTPAKPESAPRRWLRYLAIGIVAALVGFGIGYAVSDYGNTQAMNDLKSQLAIATAPGGGLPVTAAPYGTNGFSLGRQVAPISLLTRGAPPVVARTLGRQPAPVSLLTRAAPPAPASMVTSAPIGPQGSLGRQAAPTSLLSKPGPPVPPQYGRGPWGTTGYPLGRQVNAVTP
jgi:hypothetical protein